MAIRVNKAVGRDSSGRIRYSGTESVGRSKRSSGGGYELVEGGEISNEKGALIQQRIKEEKAAAEAQKIKEEQLIAETQASNAAEAQKQPQKLADAIKAQTEGQKIVFDIEAAKASALQQQIIRTGTQLPAEQNYYRGGFIPEDPRTKVLQTQQPITRTQQLEAKAREKEFTLYKKGLNPSTSLAQRAPAFTGAVIANIPQSTLQSAKDVTTELPQTIKSTGGAVKTIATRTIKGDVLAAPKVLVIEPFKENPAKFTAKTITDTATGIAAQKGLTAAKSGYIKAGSQFVEPKQVFGEPTTTSTAAALKEFEATRTPEGIQAVTVSPAPLKGETIGTGRKGGLPTPLEDPGAYFAPTGRGNPLFLRQTAGSYQGITLNPLKAFDTSIPTVSETTATNIQLQPRSVVNQPGFTATKQFLETQKGTGQLFITKRSEIGQGNIKAQQFTIKEDFTSPIAQTVDRGGTKVLTDQFKAGDILREKGTSEIEAVAPPGTRFETITTTPIGRLKGFEQYTIVNGRPVAIRQIKLLKQESQFIDNIRIKPEDQAAPRTITTRQLASESQAIARKQPTAIRSIPNSKPQQQFSSTTITSRTSSAPTFQSNTNTPRSRQTPRSNPPSQRSTQNARSNPFGGSAPQTPRSNPAPTSTPAPTSFPTTPISKATPGRSPLSAQAPKVLIPPTQPIIPRFNSPRKESSPGFNVFIRKGGQFVKANTEALTRTSAIAFGATKVKETAAATFQIRASGDKGNTFSGSGDLTDFYQSKKERNTFIQKANKRLSNRGEVREVTFAPRKKR